MQRRRMLPENSLSLSLCHAAYMWHVLGFIVHRGTKVAPGRGLLTLMTRGTTEDTIINNLTTRRLT